MRGTPKIIVSEYSIINRNSSIINQKSVLMVINLLFSRLLKKAILMALWTKASLCVKSSLLEQSLPRLVRHPCGGTPSRLRIISVNPVILSNFSLFLCVFCAFLWLKNPRNLRNLRLKYSCQFVSIFFVPLCLSGIFTTVERSLQISPVYYAKQSQFSG